MPSSSAFRCRFGSLCGLTVWLATPFARIIAILRSIACCVACIQIWLVVVAGLEQAGGAVQRERGNDLIEVGTVSFLLGDVISSAAGSHSEWCASLAVSVPIPG